MLTEVEVLSPNTFTITFPAKLTFGMLNICAKRWQDWPQHTQQCILHPRVFPPPWLVLPLPLGYFSKYFLSHFGFQVSPFPCCQAHLYLTSRFHKHILRCIVQIITKCWKAPGKHLQPSRSCWSGTAPRKAFAQVTAGKDSVPAKPGDPAAHGVSKSCRSPPGVVLLHQVKDFHTDSNCTTSFWESKSQKPQTHDLIMFTVYA